jgi:hypothetical protein
MSFRNPMRDRKWIAITAGVVIVLLLLVGYYLNYALATYGNPACAGTFLTEGCFDINYNVPASEYQGTAKINVFVANNTAMNGTIPSYAQEFKKNDTIVFHSMNISLIVFGNANTWVSEVTNTTIPAYDNTSSLSNGFAIYHMYEPNLIIPRGATVNITFVNMDFSDHHNFVLTTFAPPFPMYIMQNMKGGGEMVAMTPLLPPLDNTTTSLQGANATAFSYVVTLNLSPSVTKMWYMCMYPTHAMNGMFGNITLVNPSSVGA